MANGTNHRELEDHRRALAAFSALTREEKVERLKMFGILDAAGDLSPVYRSAETQEPTPQPHSAGNGR